MSTVRACTREEVEFLLLYRQANTDGKRRLDKALDAAVRGLLPAPEVIRAMSPAQAQAMVDALPERKA
jgi:hypothetical protein